MPHSSKNLLFCNGDKTNKKQENLWSKLIVPLIGRSIKHFRNYLDIFMVFGINNLAF